MEATRGYQAAFNYNVYFTIVEHDTNYLKPENKHKFQ